MAHEHVELRTVFISDVHLGSTGCQAAMLLDFLATIRPQTLYLVGDIVDLESLAERFYWPQIHNDVLREILSHARRGVRVVYVPGNHDIQARDFCGLNFGRVEIHHELVHVTAAGRRLLVMHGDVLDRQLDRAAWLHRVGSFAYRWLIWLNSRINAWRLRSGRGYWPIASALKHRSSTVQAYMRRFRTAALTHTREQGVDGCVMGHIHRPEVLESDGTLYMNCGDWVEHCTALVEHADGQIELLDWAQHAALTPRRLGLRPATLPQAA